jgi:Ferritin-like
VVQESDQDVGALVRLMTVPAQQRDDRWLEEGLQKAVELEMSTIPPYLYAAWSIDVSQDPSGTRDVIVGIAREEMLHMGIACNLLASIGGQPKIVRTAPRYPTNLPKHVHKGLQVALEPLSRDLLLRTFMAIEEPATHVVDDPDFVPSGSTLISDFYDAVQHAFEPPHSPDLSTAGQIDLDNSLSKGSFVVANLDDVRAAIDLIKRQGEGTSTKPFENRADPEELAHFYQFGEIAHGHRLTRTAPFTYSGDVVQMPAVRTVAPADPTAPAATQFNRLYSDLLDDLEQAWDGRGSDALGDAVGKMFALGDAAEQMIQQGVGPPFVVVDTSGSPLGPPDPGP